MGNSNDLVQVQFLVWPQQGKSTETKYSDRKAIKIELQKVLKPKKKIVGKIVISI